MTDNNKSDFEETGNEISKAVKEARQKREQEVIKRLAHPEDIVPSLFREPTVKALVESFKERAEAKVHEMSQERMAGDIKDLFEYIVLGDTESKAFLKEDVKRHAENEGVLDTLVRSAFSAVERVARAAPRRHLS